MQNAPPGGAPFQRVPYGEGELEFMLQPWFDLDIVESGTATPVGDLRAETIRRLAAPLGSPALRKLAVDAGKRAAPRKARAIRPCASCGRPPTTKTPVSST